MLLDDSRLIYETALYQYKPTHIACMVSGGKDSAATFAVAQELNIQIDFVIHGRTGCGIEETTDFVKNYYGRHSDLLIADAGTSYEEYVMRKGFFGVGITAHAFSYRVLKATPFRKCISKNIRQRKRNVCVMLLNGARKDESENRRKNLQIYREDPAAPNNVWVNLIHNWSARDRDAYLTSRNIPINPVATQLCRSGECMCGTTQGKGARLEASTLYPQWGSWLDDLEKRARALHGFGWGENGKKREQIVDTFQPMCSDCVK